MKKTKLQNTSSFQKGEVLSRSQLKNILGGFAAPGDGGGGSGDVCRIVVTNIFGGSAETTISTSSAYGSAEANKFCVNYIASNPGATCRYDCLYDGYGQ